jgi:hypothetical protein
MDILRNLDHVMVFNVYKELSLPGTQDGIFHVKVQGL